MTIARHFRAKPRSFLAPAVLSLLAACASAPNAVSDATVAADSSAPAGDGASADAVPAASGDPATPGTPGKATIVIYRSIGAVGVLAMAQPKVKLDGKAVGTCRRKDKIVVPVAPGAHRLTMATDIADRIDVSVAEGETVYVRCTLLPIGLLMPAPALYVVDEAKAAKRVSILPVQNRM